MVRLIFGNFVIFCLFRENKTPLQIILAKIAQKIPLITKFVKIKANWPCSSIMTIYFNRISRFYNYLFFFCDLLKYWWQHFRPLNIEHDKEEWKVSNVMYEKFLKEKKWTWSDDLLISKFYCPLPIREN